MRPPSTEEGVRRRFDALRHRLSERQRRLWAAAEARALGYGGVSLVARLTGVSRRAIHAGLRELDDPPPGRDRRPGGGGKPLEAAQPGLPAALDALVEPTSRGDPVSPLRYACKSVRHLAEALRGQGFRVGRQKVSELLAGLGYSLQANRKTREGKQHPDRDAQFQHIGRRRAEAAAQGRPVVSVDAKKKELLGDFANGGREGRPAGAPEEVRVHDFASKGAGKAVPYGVYDLAANEGFVSVGTSGDTSAFAVQAVRRWWLRLGQARYPRAAGLLILADGGGSNSSRGRLWKWSLQALADETGLEVAVSHYPPGTSKWNPIEHRLFSFIGVNGRAEPLTSAAKMAGLIEGTRTAKGLRVVAEVDSGTYPKGVRVTDREMKQVRVRQDEFHGDWNYTISPHPK